MISMVCNADMRGPSGVRDLLSGCWTPVCRSCHNGSLTILHRVTDGNRHNATIAAGLCVHLSSISNSRGESALRVGNFDFESRKVREFDNHYSVFNEVLSGI